jgi:hypothetical protein
MIRYKKPYIWCPFYDKFWSANTETLAAAQTRRCFVGDLAAPSRHHVALLHVTLPPRSLISLPADRWSSSSTTSEVGASRPPSHALLRSLPPLQDPRGEFPSLRSVRRVKPHWKRCPIAWATTDSGEPPLQPRRARTRNAATSPAPSQPSTSWSTAYIRSPIPFHFNKIWAVDRRINGREWSTMPWTHEPRPWTQSMGGWTYFTGFSVEK